MSILTRSRSKKRSRPGNFDLNRSIVAEEKRLRTDSASSEMQGEIDQNSGQITDLSQTISSGSNNPNTRFLPNGSGTGQDDQRGPSTMVPGEIWRQHRALENNVQLVQNEMGDLRRTIGQLSDAIRNLTDLTLSQTRATSISDASSSGNSQGSAGTGSHPDNNNSGRGNARTNDIFDRGRDNNRVRIDKLGLKFDGSSQNLGVEEFVYRLEYYQQQYSIPWEEILRDFPLIVSGPAESWFWLSQKTNKYRDWPQLKHCLLGQYQSSRSNFEILTDLVQRKQQPNETIDMFFQNMGQIRAKLVQPISEYDMIKIMKKNIKDGIGRIVYPIQVSSVEQLRLECNEAERNFPRREIRNMPPPSRPMRAVSEVYVECPSDGEYEIADYEEVSAIQYNRQSKPPLKCWNCQKLGHGFRECDSTTRALFCYRCGKPGTTSPKCPSCLQGNLNKGVDNVGGTRPSQNPSTSDK